MCRQLGQVQPALDALVCAARLEPQQPALWREMGLTYRAAEMHEDAGDCFARALGLDPADLESRLALGWSSLDSGRAEEALWAFRTAGAWSPGDGRAHCYAGVAARACGRSEEAERAFRQALALQGPKAEVWTELGILLRAQRRYAEAEEACREALKAAPKFVPAWHNLGNLLGELLRLEEAERCYAEALAVDPEYAPSRVARALLWLLQGRFEEGWPEYRWRWKQKGNRLPQPGCPMWAGEPLEGKTALLYSEQGAGDTIQFVRYAHLLRRAGARIWLVCRPELKRLMDAAPDVDRVLSQGDSVDGADVFCPLLEIPGLTGTRVETIPAREWYLSAPAGVSPDPRVQTATGLRIGLVWAGNPNHANDRNRSCLLREFECILRLEGVTFFSLQVGVAARQILDLPDVRIVHLGPALGDYAATAANLAALDGLVTVDTSVAHLAGALGRPVAALLPYAPDWRWLLDRHDSPWYPTMRLFRQGAPGDWGSVWQPLQEWIRGVLADRECGSVTKS